MSDSDVDTRRRRSRRSQRMQVNYCETSESEGSQKVTKKDKPQPHRRRLTSSNSEGEFTDLLLSWLPLMTERVTKSWFGSLVS